LYSSVNYGYTASASKDPVGPKFLRITDIVPELIDWDSVPYCQIDQKDYNKYVLHEGDIVIARTGATTGYAKHLRNIPNSVFASYLVRIRVNQNCCDRYIGLVVESEDYKRFIKANISGAAQPQANAQVLTSFPMLLPPLPSQRKIAAILSAYDDLIENNTHRIKILEEMAQLLYREWFVKLRFPGHEKVRMVESELGPIPEGWEVGKLGEIIEFQKGKKAKNVIEEQCDGFIPYLLIDGLKNYNYAYTDDKKMLIAYETDCIMVMDGASSGYVSIGHYGAVGSTLARITIKGNLNSYFLYQFLQANYKIISDNNTGSAIPHKNRFYMVCIYSYKAHGRYRY